MKISHIKSYSFIIILLFMKSHTINNPQKTINSKKKANKIYETLVIKDPREAATEKEMSSNQQ